MDQKKMNHNHNYAKDVGTSLLNMNVIMLIYIVVVLTLLRDSIVWYLVASCVIV